MKGNGLIPVIREARLRVLSQIAFFYVKIMEYLNLAKTRCVDFTGGLEFVGE
jgi:hypothetical protein